MANFGSPRALDNSDQISIWVEYLVRLSGHDVSN